MSDITTGTESADAGASSVESTPESGGESSRVSTNEIAASVFDDLEDDAGEATDADATGVEPASAAPAPETRKEPLSVVDQLLHDAGYDNDKRPDGREWRIPRSRVRVMLERGLEKHRAADAQKVATVEGEAKTLREQVQQLSALGELMERDPRAFLELVSTHDERYKPFLTPAQATAMQAQIDAEPAPDYPLPDGSRTYSLDGIKKLREFDKQQILKQLDERLKPLTEREKRIDAERRAEVEDHQRRERTGKLLADAQSWPLFGKLAGDGTYTPFQQEVLDALKADKEPGTPAEALYRAYLKVATPKFSADKNKVRDEVLKELNTAAKSPTVARTGGGSPRPAGPTSTRDIAAQAYAELERAASK